MSTVVLRNGRRFDAGADLSILEAARAQDLVLEHSCRTGRCGVCKAGVVKGETRLLRDEESLSTGERANGVILTCCRSAASDLELDIVDLGRMKGIVTRTLPCRLAAKRTVAPGVIEVTLRLPPTTPMNFLPGQYVDLIAKGVRRSYSIANAPRSDGTLELHVRRYPGGVMSNHLFDHAMDGELMRLQGPLGTFFRREERTGPMLFLATGTGIAPVKALLEEIAADPSATAGRPIAVYWGNREPEDVYWQPPESAGVRVVPVLSRALPDYAGRRGYVQDALLADWPDLRGAEVYACGSQAMIQAAEKPLVDAGLDPHAFHYDAFVSSD